HGTGTATGGIVNFSTMVTDDKDQLVKLDTLAPGTEEAGKIVVTKWGVSGGHAMTIVGYNDSVCFDYNKDGKYTTDLDITADGVVDLRDWEKGAYLVANTWGTTFADSGFVYMMYKVGAEPIAQGGLTASNNVTAIRVANDYVTKLTYKIKIKHNIRSNIRISTGIANDSAATKPDFEYSLPLFYYQGGDHPLEGKFMSDEIEIGLDVNQLLSYLSGPVGKFFLIINSQGGSGKVTSFSLLEYRKLTQISEIKCKGENVEIKKGKTTLSILYKPTIADMRIETSQLPVAQANVPYITKLLASGGKGLYQWSLDTNTWTVTQAKDTFPAIATTSVKPNNLDDGVAEQKLEFPFPFYGTSYSTIYISTDGSIVFTPDFNYIRSPMILPQYRVITVCGADLTFEYPGDSIYFEGSKDSATIRWQTQRFWGKDDKVNIDCAVRLYPSGLIKFFYNKDFTNGLTGMAFGVSAGNNKDFQLLDIDNTAQIQDKALYALNPFKMVPGIVFTPDGTLSGTPTEANKAWKMVITCKDSVGLSKTKVFQFSTMPSIAIKKVILATTLSGINLSQRHGSLFINFTLKNSANVKVDILSVSGRTIATLTNGMVKAGLQNLQWNHLSGDQTIASSGMYLCKISVDNAMIVQKFAVIR
ncbi:MAG: T9SS type A sorting domain-containing protein, partial [Chitinivibrionales bacterium]|nr:T9SS type A sorting domain-containing protein [Chitinivibrionales bacterium]